MRTFEEVVNDIAKEGYCLELDKYRLKQVFNSLHPHVIWCGTYWGWQSNDVWKEVCEAVHKYMQEEMEPYLSRASLCCHTCNKRGSRCKVYLTVCYV